ncbi:MAG: hypothetical protein WBB01_09135 [Phormidesmis sp.]
MINTSQFNHPSIKAALYYVRLKTHGSSRLFELPESQAEYSESSVLVSSCARIVADELLLSAADHKGITLDQWAVVPDALHALICLHDPSDQGLKIGKPRLLTSFIAGFKAVTAKRINLVRNQPGTPVWQRSYKEQRMADELMLSHLRKRISTIDSTVISG